MPVTPNVPKSAISLKAALTLIGSVFVVIAGVWQGWGTLNEHWALQSEMIEMNRTLQLRDNVNYLESRKNITQYDINRINDVLQMYQTRELLNGSLDAADRNRVQSLEIDMTEAQKTMDGIDDSIQAMRLSIED
jgi:hypothetical protein